MKKLSTALSLSVNRQENHNSSEGTYPHKISTKSYSGRRMIQAFVINVWLMKMLHGLVGFFKSTPSSK